MCCKLSTVRIQISDVCNLDFYCKIFLHKIHEMNAKATPESKMQYKLSIQMFKLYNSNDHSLEWIHLNFNQILTSQQTKFSILKSNIKKVGLNTLSNRLSALNGKIPLHWLNNSIDTFKIKCKNLILN